MFTCTTSFHIFFAGSEEDTRCKIVTSPNFTPTLYYIADSRAIFFEDVTYSKRKIEDFLSTLGGFKAAQRLLAKVKVTAADFRSVFVCMTKSLSLADAFAQQLS